MIERDRPAARVITRDQPGLWWLSALLFVSVGVAFLGIGVVEAPRGPAWRSALAAGAGLIAVGVGLWQAWNAPWSSVALDAASHELQLVQHGLYGRRIRRLPVSSIADVIVEHQADEDGDRMARPAVVLRDGTVVPLSALWRHDPEGIARVAEQVRAALPLPRL